MPNFKPKKFLIRVLGGKSRKNEDDMDYLSAGFERFLSHANIRDDDDGDSMITILTMETVDNQPGTGRLIDTYIFQPLGRRIERLAMRFTIASLHPARIVQYIEASYSLSEPYNFEDSMTLPDVIARLCRRVERNGSTVVSGMKGLVKQTQSSSINRSATALAALVRVSLTVNRREFYVNVSRIEPIFHLETLVDSLHCSRPERKWLILLARLARENLIAVRNPWYDVVFDPESGRVFWDLLPSREHALHLRQRLKQALKVYRSSGYDSLDDTIGEAVAICAEAVSTCIDDYARGDAYIHVLETVYFTVIFILRSIPELVDVAKNTANSHIYMVLRTLSFWVGAIIYRCLVALRQCLRFSSDKVKAKMAFRSLSYVCAYYGTAFLSEKLLLFHCPEKVVLDMRAIPIRFRNTAKLANNSPIVQGLIDSAEESTQQLIRSFDKLEKEVWGCASQTNYFPLLKMQADPVWSFFAVFGDEWWEYWSIILGGDGVIEWDFDIALNSRYQFLSGISDDKRWAHYCKSGQHLPSSLDYDWDIETCMEHLVMLELQIQEGSSPPAHATPTSSPAVDLGVVPGESWSILAGEAHGALPKEVKIAYKTKDGKTQYTSFVPASSSPGHDHPISETATSGPSGGAQVIDEMETGASSSDSSQTEAYEDTPVEAFNDDVEGKETVCDVGVTEVRKGGDAISICSLD